MSEPQRMSRLEPEYGDRLADVAESLAHAVRTLEDIDDLMDADAAWEQRGKSIPLAALEAELDQG